ncbi:probable 2-oxoglutarate dehydrogenase E1 component DHKTD1, mitochondrial [Lytechinus variegatus]|uniref:probable 2-oxoglutarate dehydrogenase E1 component DHKTD1, mitochondrial n=1 Tax=Lytechinus variegatus TaxID=7654 RepID=UPI001BB2806A|nr:probable 2-oxoglutarate dehydrogenase E1 component DHKTD1, mitochondrial [Lytechinus variegatus]
MLRFFRHSRARILSQLATTPSGRRLAGAVPAVQHQTSRSYNVGRDVYGFRQSAWQPLNLIGLQQQAEGEKIITDKAVIQNRIENANLLRLVTAYREHGHKRATLDPLGLLQLQSVPELDPHLYGLSPHNSELYNLTGIVNIGKKEGTIQEVIEHLQKAYCGSIAVEFAHLLTSEEREWFSNEAEESPHWFVSNATRQRIAQLMADAQAFDQFMTTKFATVKRYGGEGAESMMAFFHQLFTQAVSDGVEDIVLAMPHRGRLNLLMGPLGFSPLVMMKKLRGNPEYAPHLHCVGDIPTHLWTSVDLDVDGKELHLSLIPNPSHLEANIPVGIGKARGRQMRKQEGDYAADLPSDCCHGDKVLNVLLHGDAAFVAQGVIAECFAMANLPHYAVGGSIHLVVNNQIGFTTPSERGRSSPYCSDIAKMNGNPVIHVNGMDPEAVLSACRLAVSYRHKFRKDVVVDFLCFRRWGHNELDDPSFTQPIMYDNIRSRLSIPDTYIQKAAEEGSISKEEIDKNVSEKIQEWNRCLKEADSSPAHAYESIRQGQWSSCDPPPSHIALWDTGVETDLLKFIGGKSVEIPNDFGIHPHLKKIFVDARLKKLEEGSSIDWATAESLAFGSLLLQGFNVRLSGQDVGRGTFSHRHAMLVDQDNDSIHIPLNHIDQSQRGFFEVANSPLSEEAVLGFEYGMSIETPNLMVIWEAQFGDFFNAAQTIIDTYIFPGELKWLLQSSLVMLLPHGFDGAGPEHSSCRLERFLQACDSSDERVDGDNVNVQIANPTTPAQYFHLLRRQMVRNYRKPLIMASPKILLRLPAATSDLSEMGPGTSFRPVIDDKTTDPKSIQKIIICCGKHYYALQKERESRQAHHIAIVRVESLCPFPADVLQSVLSRYTNAKEYVWSQEEHKNMGAWSFVAPRFENLVGYKLAYAGRDVLGVPAVGTATLHQEEVRQIMVRTFDR